MRIAYVCRDLAVDDLIGAGARAFAVADVMRRAGHQGHLVCEALAGPWLRAVRGGEGLEWTPVAPGPADHRYFTERQEYADRVYQTLSELHRAVRLDVVEFAAAEAVTTIRAKRLLGEFPSTVLGVRPREPEGIAAAATQSIANYDDAIAAFQSRYAVEHADVVLDDASCSIPVAKPTNSYTNADTHTVWHLGDLRPGTGVETFLRAAELVVRQDPDYRFVLAGRDTDSDPFGRSFYRYATRRLSSQLQAALTFVGPPREGALPSAGSQCVVSGPVSARLAMALGQVVIASVGSAEELAATLLENAKSPASAARLAEAAAGASQDRPSAAELAASYRPREAGQKPMASQPELVSVIIPLYNQGDYVADAIESVRACGYQNVEIVVVDDGSTDPETIAAFDALRDVVKVRQPNSGLSAARNAGIAACGGRYVLPLDADDLLPAGFVGAAVHALGRDPELAYVTGHVRHFGLLEHTYVPVGHVPGLSLVLNTHARATGLFRKAAVEAVGGYDEELPACEDWDLYLSLAAAGYQSDVLPMLGQRYRRHSDSMTFSASNAMRLPLLQYLLRKYAPKASAEDAAELPLILAQLWKTQYEPSASVLWQRDGREPQPRVPAPQDPSPENSAPRASTPQSSPPQDPTRQVPAPQAPVPQAPAPRATWSA